ncbi:hypothetical protein ACFWWM_17895 [Streptomyces sp. NPDC058682]|uniref:hypothetical protein n=1 Tax=unclassified Streptomyces TaxID=2593676 RepID=UPI0022514637|nr:hypothetical protein [Streptomyces sp. NBC_01214]MCX4800306.1 hypothetical protein [Streptomyces sp. NBC_01214]
MARTAIRTKLAAAASPAHAAGAWHGCPSGAFIVNNQTDGWVDRLRYCSYGSTCDAYVQPPGTTWQENPSPMNSIKLSRY